MNALLYIAALASPDHRVSVALCALATYRMLRDQEERHSKEIARLRIELAPQAYRSRRRSSWSRITPEA